MPKPDGCICAWCCTMGAQNALGNFMAWLRDNRGDIMRLMGAPNSNFMHNSCLKRVDSMLPAKTYK